jgi:hypothetical protein
MASHIKDTRKNIKRLVLEIGLETASTWYRCIFCMDWFMTYLKRVSGIQTYGVADKKIGA